MPKLPVYVRHWAPDYAKSATEGYAPWFVGHTDQDALTDEALDKVADQLRATYRGDDWTDQFHLALEKAGYTCFHTTVHAEAPYVLAVPA